MVNIIGLGYIGLPTALMMASHGIEVVGTDCKAPLVEKLKAGHTTFEEKGLDDLFQEAVQRGIRFTTEYQKAGIYVVSVPTPYDKKSRKIDAGFVVAAVEKVIAVCPKGAILIIESTISPGTIDRFIRPLIRQSGLVIGRDIHLAHAPERILPGNMVYELLHNARTIGADDLETAESVKKLYASFCRGEIVTTSIRIAEMTKVVENTFRDINIAYANELVKICRSDNIDVYEVISIANMHPRVHILQPGPGVGGHCMSVDPWFLVGDYPEMTKIIRMARDINDSMPEYVLKRISDIMDEHHMSDISRVGFYGITYKENVDDIRESPTLQLIECMKRHLSYGAKVFDPMVQTSLSDIRSVKQYFRFDEFLQSIDLIVIMVGHQHLIQNMDLIREKIILDTRHVCPLEGVYRL